MRGRRITWLRSARRSIRKLPLAVRLAFAALALIALGAAYENMTYYNPDYTPLLNTIAKGESRGNYNAYYGNASNAEVHFTDMTVAEVLKWQEDYVRHGSPSSAVGKYQIVRPTLLGLVKQLKIDPAKTRFDENTQDRLAAALLERRGARDYMSGKLTREQFAANLAQEWAALPKVTGPNPHESYYAGDGLNQARISVDEVFAALAIIKS